MAVQFLESASGFLAINKKMVMRLSDISLNYNVATEETASFDNNFIKTFEPGFSDWTADASFIADSVTTGYTSYTGGTAASTLTGSTNGFDVFETIKNRAKLGLVIKLASGNVQRGTVIIGSVDIKASAGKFASGSIKLQGTGALTKSST